MAIQNGQKREHQEYSKKIGVFQGSVICVNPDAQQYSDLLGIELKEDSKATEYLGQSKEDNTSLRVNIWLEEEKTKEKFCVTFYLENKERENKDMTKNQWINSNGMTCWAESPNSLPEWFLGDKKAPRDYRKAYVGEEELYNFVRFWLSDLDWRSASIDLNWKKLMKGNVSEISDLIGCEYVKPVGCMATVVIKEDAQGESKEYQGVYNKAFFYGGALKQFRLVDYNQDEIQQRLLAKKPKDQKPHEKFVAALCGEYGPKNTLYTFSELKDYNAEEYLVASDKAISEEGADF